MLHLVYSFARARDAIFLPAHSAKEYYTDSNIASDDGSLGYKAFKLRRRRRTSIYDGAGEVAVAATTYNGLFPTPLTVTCVLTGRERETPSYLYTLSPLCCCSRRPRKFWADDHSIRKNVAKAFLFHQRQMYIYLNRCGQCPRSICCCSEKVWCV